MVWVVEQHDEIGPLLFDTMNSVNPFAAQHLLPTTPIATRGYRLLWCPRSGTVSRWAPCVRKVRSNASRPNESTAVEQ